MHAPKNSDARGSPTVKNMQKISQLRFNALAGYTRAPLHELFGQELE